MTKGLADSDLITRAMARILDVSEYPEEAAAVHSSSFLAANMRMFIPQMMATKCTLHLYGRDGFQDDADINNYIGIRSLLSFASTLPVGILWYYDGVISFL